MSWNISQLEFCRKRPVTLHVSVWVEIGFQSSLTSFSLSRSTWACELKFTINHLYIKVISSRSTWACELKSHPQQALHWRKRHAPRERVSWNIPFVMPYRLEVGHAPRERVSWNCKKEREREEQEGHAPRERVSWNVISPPKYSSHHVTLHVSVWVEISSITWRSCSFSVTLHVSVWVEMPQNELQNIFKLVTLHVSVWVEIRLGKVQRLWLHVTLHVSVWVEMSMFGSFSGFQFVTLHVSVWVEIFSLRFKKRVKLSRSTWACELKC